jgi:hypothetical protein
MFAPSSATFISTVSINGCSTAGGLVARLCCRRFHKWLQGLTPAIDKLGGDTKIFPLTPKPCSRRAYQVLTFSLANIESKIFESFNP